MDRETHLLCETVQEITLAAWPIVWADNKYDQDSRNVLEMLRDWAEEFEKWWMSHDEDWMDRTDYVEEVWKFVTKKSEEYIKQFE